jgi:hypothetical protein
MTDEKMHKFVNAFAKTPQNSIYEELFEKSNHERHAVEILKFWRKK